MVKGAGPEVHRWQVQLGVSYNVPFARGRYRVCVKHLSLTGDFTGALMGNFIHVVSEPEPSDARLWVDADYCLNPLRVINLDNTTSAFYTADEGTQEWFLIDLAINPNFAIHLTDGRGNKIKATGRCIVHFMSLDGCV